MTHPTAGLDEVVHQRTRLGILAILSRGDRVEFGYLKDTLDLTAGNLSRHLTTLVEARLVNVHKGYQGRRPRTWVSITKTGNAAYQGEIAILRSLLALQDAGIDADDATDANGADDAGVDATDATDATDADEPGPEGDPGTAQIPS